MPFEQLSINSALDIAAYANRVSSNAYGYGLLASLWFVLFLSLRSGSSSITAAMVASFICAIASAGLWSIGFVPVIALEIFAALTIGTVFLKAAEAK